MKKIVLAIALLSGLLFTTGCDRFNPMVRFDVDYVASITVESGSILNIPVDFITPDITTNSEAEFEANDTRKDLVEEINLDNLTLKITSPSGKTFSFLKDIYLYIDADGLDEARFAYKENVDNEDTQITLDKDPVNLAEYIKKEKFKIRAETVTRETLNQDIDITAEMLFNVRARVRRK